MPTQLEPNQVDFVCGYLNKHHPDVILSFVKMFSSIGQEMAKSNAWSGNSFSVHAARIQDITTEDFVLQAEIQQRHKRPENRTVQVPLDADFAVKKRGWTPLPLVEEDSTRWPIDSVCRKLCRLCWMVQEPQISGKLVQLAIQLGGKGVGKIPENMYEREREQSRLLLL